MTVGQPLGTLRVSPGQVSRTGTATTSTSWRFRWASRSEWQHDIPARTSRQAAAKGAVTDPNALPQVNLLPPGIRARRALGRTKRPRSASRSCSCSCSSWQLRSARSRSSTLANVPARRRPGRDRPAHAAAGQVRRGPAGPRPARRRPTTARELGLSTDDPRGSRTSTRSFAVLPAGVEARRRSRSSSRDADAGAPRSRRPAAGAERRRRWPSRRQQRDADRHGRAGSTRSTRSPGSRDAWVVHVGVAEDDDRHVVLRGQLRPCRSPRRPTAAASARKVSDMGRQGLHLDRRRRSSSRSSSSVGGWFLAISPTLDAASRAPGDARRRRSAQRPARSCSWRR